MDNVFNATSRLNNLIIQGASATWEIINYPLLNFPLIAACIFSTSL